MAVTGHECGAREDSVNPFRKGHGIVVGAVHGVAIRWGSEGRRDRARPRNERGC